MYRIRYQPRARKDLLALPEEARLTIAHVIDSLSSTPRPRGAEKLAGKGRSLHRVRAGRYRVIYEVRDKEVLVLVVRVARRDERTYRGR